MLLKDPEKRIDNLGIFDHPWVRKYKKFGDDSESENNKRERSSSRTNSSFYGENQVEKNFDSDHVGLDIKSPWNNSLHNIEEHDNETTGNFARVDLKPKVTSQNNNNYNKMSSIR